MYRLCIRHITFIGSGLDDASVEFGLGMTLVRGPSDTGKSFIADAIDFMLGANALKEIPERDGYSTALLD
jgi:DNA repair ATPase RecN